MRKEKRKKEKKKKKNHFGKFLLTILMLLVIVAGSFFGYFVYLNGGGLQGVLATILGQTPETLQDLDTINVLLLRYK